MKVFGHPMSTCTRKVLTTLNEIGMAFEMNVVDLAKGEHKQHPHLDRQPFGQIPAIEDNGFELYESRAICRYLDEKVGGKLVPKDIQGRARVEQWISIETSNFSGHAMKFVYEHMLKRKQEEEVLANAHKHLTLTLGVMEKQLASNQHIAGEDFTLADIGFMPYIEYLTVTPIKADLEKHAKVWGWWQNISNRPSWRKATNKST